MATRTRTRIRITLMALIIPLFIVSTVNAQTLLNERNASLPEPPSLPSKDPDDYILGLYYMFFTGDYSLLQNMIGPSGTQYFFPYGIGFFPLGRDNEQEVRSIFENTPKLFNAQCVGVDPARHSKFTVFFDGIQFEETDQNSYIYFLFMTNEAGYWELLVMGTIDKNLFSNMEPPMGACPVNNLELPDERGAPDWFLGSPAVFVDSPPAGQEEINSAKSQSLFRRLFPQAHAEGCTPRRTPIDDNNDAWTWCTEYAAQMRPDALCWLDYYADAHKWDDYAEKYGKGIVSKPDNHPMEGDIAVWNTSCGEAFEVYGHVAIVTRVYQDSNGKTRINVNQANRNNDGKVGPESDILVNDKCMKFIHEPGVGFDTEATTKTSDNTQPDQQKESWWMRFLRYVNTWCQ